MQAYLLHHLKIVDDVKQNLFSDPTVTAPYSRAPVAFSEEPTIWSEARS
ncbi:hypothetical protein DFAR_2960010 [Desulfarculales bacterium]